MPTTTNAAAYVRHVCDLLDTTPSALARMIGRTPASLNHVMTGRTKALDPIIVGKLTELVAEREAKAIVEQQEAAGEVPRSPSPSLHGEAIDSFDLWIAHLRVCGHCLAHTYLTR